MPLTEFDEYLAIQALLQRFNQAETDGLRAVLAVLRVAAELHQNIDEFLASANLSHLRFIVLAYLELAGEDGLVGTDLAMRTPVTRATITNVIDALERRSLVVRTPHPSDRRKSIIRITELGQRFLQELAPKYLTHLTDLGTGVDETCAPGLMESLRRILNGVRRVHKR